MCKITCAFLHIFVVINAIGIAYVTKFTQSSNNTKTLTVTIQNNKVEETISSISEQLKLKETAIFCGAGISYNSGLPLVNDLMKYILNTIGVNNVDVDKLLQSSLPFEAFIQTLKDEASVDDILDIFSKGEPNANHELIAELLKRRFIKSVMTTNFDTLIEKALMKIGLTEGLDYQVFSTEKEFENIDWQSNTIKLIKIHGCISNKKEMAITLELVARKTIRQHKSNLISSFFSGAINQDLLVVGYSCSDLFDISPIIESMNGNKSKITFIEHQSQDIDTLSEDISIKDYKNPFQGYIGKRIYIHTDEFTKQIWNRTCLKPYEIKRSSISWKENIDKWLQGVDVYSLGMRNQISARLFYSIGEYNIAIKSWERGIAIAQKENNLIFFYAQLGNIGMTLNALGKFIDAKNCIEESVNALRDIGNIQGEISQLQTLGNIYRNLGEFDSAIISYNRAVFLAEKYDIEALCKALGNLVSIFIQRKQPDEAIKVLDKGLMIAKELGDKQSEGSMMTSLGIAFFQKGENEKAIKFLLESMTLTRQIGDKQGECMSLHNLSNFYLHNEDFENCLRLSINGLEIAKQIGIRPSEAAAYYNIGSCYLLKGEYEPAVLYLKKAIEFYKDIFGVNHSNTNSAIVALDRAMQFKAQTKQRK